jgi:hypothetical protein
MNSIRRYMIGDCWIGWDSVVRTHVFSVTVWFQRERIEALLLLIMGHVLVSWCWQRMSWNRDIRTSNRWSEFGSTICNLEKRYASGGDCVGGVHNPTF